MPRTHDLVLVGATGFTGALTAEYLARHAPADCRWAIAGRNRSKLERLRERLAAIDPRHAELPLLHADVTDPASLKAVAGDTRVLASTVGPFILHGAALVAACAEAGTDYLDITGEPEFVDLMYLRHHRRAQETGARLVHSCGFDSVPYDLGVLYTLGKLPQGEPVRVDGYVRASGALSGGTLASALLMFSRTRQVARTARERRQADPRPEGRTVRTPRGRLHRSHVLRAWGVPLPTLDPQVVGRSAAALDAYGPVFQYRHFAAVKRLPIALAGMIGAVKLAALAQIPAVRRALTGRLGSGQGPSPERRSRSWFSARFVGEAGGRRVLTEVAGGDPGYEETAKMLAESALCLAMDNLPRTSGQVTTAVAMGDSLIARLERAGITFRVLKRA